MPRPWTEAEEATLRKRYLVATVEEIAAELGRTAGAVYDRIRVLKVATSSPLKTVGAAAERLGFTYAEFDSVIARARVTCSVIGPKQRRIITRTEADRAAKEWLATENVTQAARARDISSKMLRRWLLEAGVLRAAEAQPRVKTATIDQVIAERRAQEGRAA